MKFGLTSPTTVTRNTTRLVDMANIRKKKRGNIFLELLKSPGWPGSIDWMSSCVG